MENKRKQEQKIKGGKEENEERKIKKGFEAVRDRCYGWNEYWENMTNESRQTE